MHIETAVIPSAGYGTRLLPITKIISKSVLPIGTIPILSDVLWEAYMAGIRRVLIITHWREETIKNLIKSEARELEDWLKKRGRVDLIEKINKLIPDMEIEFIRQEVLNGLGGAILLAEDYIDKHFCVLLSDNIIIEKNKGSLLGEMMKIFEATQPSTLLAVAKVNKSEVKRFGIIEYKKQINVGNALIYEVSNLMEKPDPNIAPSNLAIVGRYIFTAEIFEYLRGAPIIGKEIDETKAFKAQIDSGRKVFAIDLGGRRWFDVGNIEGYTKAFVSFIAAMEGKDKVRKWLNEVI
ncbi:MAG: sugar phosphate nucleotidyltransferase [Candidatus Njordarchaeota archaeon]